MRANVSGRTGQEDGHGLVLNPCARSRTRVRNIDWSLGSSAVFMQGEGTIRPHFHRAALNQWVNPPPQCWDVNVDPVIPPINGGRIVPKCIALLRRKRGGK